MLLATAVATASAATALALLSGPSGAAERADTQSASARLVQLTGSPVAPLGTAAFQGTYGRADSPDPDGVLDSSASSRGGSGSGGLAGTGADEPGPLALAALALGGLGTTVLTVLHLRRRPRRH